MDDLEVYDLGEADGKRLRRVLAPKIRRARARHLPPSRRSPVPAVAGSLSLLLPGSGQLLVGPLRLGILLLSAAAFFAAFVWAILATFDRLIPTLDLLGVPPQVAVIALGVALLSVGALHTVGVVEAHRVGTNSAEASVPHPALTGIASLLVPGWGQMLGGHRGRAATLLGAVWALSLAWVAVSPPGQRILSLAGAALPSWARDGFGPLVLVSLTAVTWVLAVYDAVAGAHTERGR
jgi:hypothetical protein